MTELHVRGIPAPKGSARAMLIGGRSRLIASSSNANARAQAAWVNAIRSAWAKAVAPLTGPCWVNVLFHMPRPRGHYGTGRNSAKLKPSAPPRPTSFPDLDKLVRTTLDALTGLAFADDSQVVSIAAAKAYAVSGATGADIGIGAA